MPDQFVLPNLKSKEEHIHLLCATALTTEEMPCGKLRQITGMWHLYN